MSYSCRSSGACFDAYRLNGNVNELDVRHGSGGSLALRFLGKHADPGLAERLQFPMQIDFQLFYGRSYSTHQRNGWSVDTATDRIGWSMEDFPSLEVYQDTAVGVRQLAFDPEETPLLGIPFGLSSLQSSGITGGATIGSSSSFFDPVGATNASTA